MRFRATFPFGKVALNFSTLLFLGSSTQNWKQLDWVSMEPVTHMLTGACLSRTGLNRRAAYATLTMAIAAEFPDIDTLWSLRGPIEGFQHHRGITHTFLGLPFEAALIVAGVYAWHRWRVRRARATTTASRPLTGAPVRWGG